MAIKKKAIIDIEYCVACGTCVNTCPKSAIHINKGVIAVISAEKCIGCGKCSKVCPANIIRLEELAHE